MYTYISHENEKKRNYNSTRRGITTPEILNVQKQPLLLLPSMGGMGKELVLFYKKVAEESAMQPITAILS